MVEETSALLYSNVKTKRGRKVLKDLAKGKDMQLNLAMEELRLEHCANELLPTIS